MKCSLLKGSLGACVLLAAAGTVMAPSADAGAATVVRAQVAKTCLLGSKAINREITGLATIRLVAGTKKLAVQFVLQEHANSGGPYLTDTTPQISAWQSPTSPPPSYTADPGYSWQASQPVDGLYRGYTYRFQVKFRWYGAGGKVIKHESLYTSGCKVPAK